MHGPIQKFSANFYLACGELRSARHAPQLDLARLRHLYLPFGHNLQPPTILMEPDFLDI